MARTKKLPSMPKICRWGWILSRKGNGGKSCCNRMCSETCILETTSSMSLTIHAHPNKSTISCNWYHTWMAKTLQCHHIVHATSTITCNKQKVKTSINLISLSMHNHETCFSFLWRKSLQPIKPRARSRLRLVTKPTRERQQQERGKSTT
jgi:hypothetical protein